MTNDVAYLNQEFQYNPFGSTRVSEQYGGLNQRNQYIGQDLDQETSLSYLNARYYDGERGRFLGQDPVFWEVGLTRDGIVSLYNPQLQNSYSYAANNPIVNKDPDGRFLDTVLDVGFIAYDIYRVGSAIANGGDVKGELTSLGLDVGGALLPGVTGLGAVARVARTADNAVDAASGASKVADKAEEAYSVYVLKEGNTIKYVGITKQDLNVRWKQHASSDPAKRNLRGEVVGSGMTKTQARLMEQAGIEANGGVGGGQLLNQRNSISRNSDLYKSASNSIKSASSLISKGDYAGAYKGLSRASRTLRKVK